MDEIINAWKQYLDNLKDWEAVIDGVTPKKTQCGPVYEPDSPLPEHTETFAISDMRGVKVALPHYHKNGENEAIGTFVEVSDSLFGCKDTTPQACAGVLHSSLGVA